MNPPWKCVRFAPTEFEIFDEFLKPKVENDVAGLQYSLIENFDLYDEDPIRANKGPHDFFAANNFWFFVTRVRAGPNSLLADRRIRNNPDKGKWLKFGKTRHILRGAENLGCVQTFDYVKNNLKTGWRQHEYTPAVDGVLFQTNAVSHLLYDNMLDRTLLEVAEQDGEHNVVAEAGELHGEDQNQNLNGVDNVENHGEDHNLNNHGEEDQDLNALLNDHNLNGVGNVENHGEEDQDLNALLNDHNLNGVGNVENHGEEDQDLNALLNDHNLNGVGNVENHGEEDQDLNELLNHNLNGVDNVENHGEDQDFHALLENHGDDQNFHAFINGVDNVENLGVQNVEAFLNDDAFDPDDMFQYDEFPVATP